MNQTTPTSEHKASRRKAIDLVGLLGSASLIVLLLFAGLQWTSTSTERARARKAIARAYVAADGPAAKALDAFKYNLGRHPTTDEGLVALLEAPATNTDSWRGPYLENEWEYLTDPWENQFEYRCPGTHNPESYDLWSRGPNGTSEPDDPESDDIGNW